MFHLVDVFAIYAMTLVGARHVIIPTFQATEALLTMGEWLADRIIDKEAWRILPLRSGTDQAARGLAAPADAIVIAFNNSASTAICSGLARPGLGRHQLMY
jgi:hypothetical protein